MKIVEEDFYPLEEMARLGFINDLEIYVRTDDPGKIPHFHICDRETKGQKFHTCVQISKCAYFKHTGKEDTLNSKQRKDLVEFLGKIHKSKKFSNWEYLIAIWNDNNSDVEVPVDCQMPDYTKLK